MTQDEEEKLNLIIGKLKEVSTDLIGLEYADMARTTRCLLNNSINDVNATILRLDLIKELNMNKPLLDKVMTGVAAVNVRTLKEYVWFTRLLKAFGFEIETGKKSYPTWELYKEETCIRFKRFYSISIEVSHISYFEKCGYEIIKFSDLMKNDDKS